MSMMRRLGTLTLALFLAACGEASEGDLRSLATGHLVAFEVHDTPQASPAIGFADSNDETVTLADFEGQVVLLNVWATWCAPCVREMPQLNTLQEEYGGEDFAVITVSTDRRSRAEVESFLYEEIGATNLPIYMDSSLEFALGVGVGVWPTTILYARDGRELGRLAGPAEWDSADAYRFIEAAIEAE